MTSTFDSKRVPITFAQRLIIVALAIGAILLALSPPAVHATPNDGPGTEPLPPNGSSDQYPSLALPPLVASQNPVVFYGSETKKNIDLTWTPYPWAPVQVHFKAVGSPQHAGQSAPFDPSVTDSDWTMEVYYGRTYQVQLHALWPSKLAGPTITITTVKIELASTDPPPLRVNPSPIPGDNPHSDPPDTQRLNPGAAAGNTREDRTSGSSQGEDSKKP